jgi:hypothetical protein
MTTDLTTTKEQIDLKEAESNLEKFLQLQTQKAAIDASMKAYKESLKAFAERNELMIDEKGNLNLTAGYLHFGKKTFVKFPKKFSIVKFLQKFPALIDWKFKTAPVKAHFENEKTKKQMAAFGLKLDEEKTFDIIAAKAEKQNS